MSVCFGQPGTKIYDVVRASKTTHRSWSLLGLVMSVKCIAALVGIRSDRIKTAGSGALDHRYACLGAVTH